MQIIFPHAVEPLAIVRLELLPLRVEIFEPGHQRLVVVGTEAQLDAAAVPRPPRLAAAAAKLGVDPQALAERGGEDYEQSNFPQFIISGYDNT